MDFWKEYHGGTSYHIISGVYDSHMASLSTWQYLSDFLIILPVIYSFLWKSVTKSRTHSMGDGENEALEREPLLLSSRILL